MANHKSSIKRMRQTKKRNAHNRANKSRVRAIAKEVETVLAKDGAEAAAKVLHVAESSLAKAARRGTIHWKTAARKTSRLAKRVKAASTGVASKAKKK